MLNYVNTQTEKNSILSFLFQNPATLQKRNKLKPDTMENLFHSFNRKIKSKKTFQGYELLACDGADQNIFRDPKDKKDTFSWKERAWNFWV